MDCEFLREQFLQQRLADAGYELYRRGTGAAASSAAVSAGAGGAMLLLSPASRGSRSMFDGEVTLVDFQALYRRVSSQVGQNSDTAGMPGWDESDAIFGTGSPVSVRIRMTFLSADPKTVERRNAVEIHADSSSTVLFAFASKGSSNTFARAVDSALQNGQNKTSLHAYIGSLLDSVGQRRPQRVIARNVCIPRDDLVFREPNDSCATLARLASNAIAKHLSCEYRRRGMDMLLCILRLAATGPRNILMTVPFPSFLLSDRKDANASALADLVHCIDQIPVLDSIAQDQGAILFDKPMSIKILQWTIFLGVSLTLVPRLETPTNSATRIEQSLIFDVSGSSELHDLSAASPDEVLSAYHGTDASCAFSILCNGLRPMGGTRLVRNGQAYGDGVYLSTDQKVAELFASQCSTLSRKIWTNSHWCQSSRNDVAQINVCVECKVADVKSQANISNKQLIKRIGEQQGGGEYLVVNEPQLMRVRRLRVSLVVRKRVDSVFSGSVANRLVATLEATCKLTIRFALALFVLFTALLLARKFT